MRKTTGLSLLLLIFLSLCLIIFSLLSLSGATADETLSQKTAERTKQYYAAVSEANQILANIDTLLSEQLRNIEHTAIPADITSDSLSDLYIMNCINALQADFPECATTDMDTLSLTFSVPVTEHQLLRISISVTYPYLPEDTLYQITEWKVVNTDTWIPDLSQKVYIPEITPSDKP